MATYSFRDARKLVVDTVLASRQPHKQVVPLSEASGRVLAEIAVADRDFPPVARSIRDGFAVRSADLPGSLRIIGEVRAGGRPDTVVSAGQCVEVMTGAPMPSGADAVVMVEQVRRNGTSITTDRVPQRGEFVNPAGAEARRGQPLLPAGVQLGYTQIALLAAIGQTRVTVFRRPSVAILSTGDEVVPIEAVPTDNQVRNCNAWSLAAQVSRCGGEPEILPVAPDEPEMTSRLISEGFACDLLLLSGGVSAGKYDFVEPALAALGAEFLFDRVLIQPGQPLVFGRARDRFFFGLPGNPASTMVTFELFGRAAVELLGGRQSAELFLPRLRLTENFQHKPGLTRFLPAAVNTDGTEVTPIRWQGSSDIPALARANAFLVAEAGRESWKEGDLIGVLMQ